MRLSSRAAIAAICVTSALASPARAQVLYYPHDDVEAAFAKGDVLFGGDAERNYMVHASRRDSAGQAEVHARDTDIIYALDGSATFVTGGEIVDASASGPDEIRGRSIRGGESRELVEGDVIIVPRGTPHWFKDVPGPFTYYVVKVR